MLFLIAKFGRALRQRPLRDGTSLYEAALCAQSRGHAWKAIEVTQTVNICGCDVESDALQAFSTVRCGVTLRGEGLGCRKVVLTNSDQRRVEQNEVSATGEHSGSQFYLE